MTCTRITGRLLLSGWPISRTTQQQSFSSASIGRSTSTSSSSSRPFSSCTAAQKADGPWSDLVNKPLNRYVIIAEDYGDAGALARRLEVRDRHLEQAARGKEAGRIELGGGLLKRDFRDIDPDEGPTTSLAGSILIVQGESIEDVRARLHRDEYSRAGVFDPSKIRIFPFLRSFNEQSVAVGHEAIGETKPVSLRRPVGESTVKSSFNRRNEVYVKDPRGSGMTVNAGDRRSAESTLGHLRSTQKPPQQHQTAYTLDKLRKTPVASSS